jgi:hypothetical protein
MSDLPSSLGIEAVELVSTGGATVTVRVTGRWRRRRPELRGQAMLVVEAKGGRQRFLAMPEPPSLMGAAPGTWRMSFGVPAELAPELPGRTFLQLGSVMVPLPVGSAAGPAEPERASPDLLEPRLIRSSEVAAESARRRATEAEGEAADLIARIEDVERELEQARRESDTLRADIAARERRLRGSEQHVYAERALRSELEHQLIERTRVSEHDEAVLRARVRDLERELERMRRAVDEAQHLVAAAQAHRAAAEEKLAARPEAPAPAPEPPAQPPEPPVEAIAPAPVEFPPPPVVDRVRAEGFAAELALSMAAATSRTSGSRRVPGPAGVDGPAMALEAAMAERRAEGGAGEGRATEQLAAEQRAAESQAAAEAQLAAERHAAEERLAAERQAAERLAAERLAAAEEQLAAERRAAEQLAAERLAAEQRATELERALAEARIELAQQRRLSARAYEAIELVRGELEQLRRAIPPPPSPAREQPSPPTPGPVQAEQLSAALARLRETTPAPPPEAEEPIDEPELAQPAAPAKGPARAAEALPATAEPEAASEPEAATEPETGTEAPTPEATESPTPEATEVPTPEATEVPTPEATEVSTPAEAEPEPATATDPVIPERLARPWLKPVFRTLTRRDPATAGRLVLALLPAQRAADPHPVAYDLVLGDLATAHVTVSSSATEVALNDTPRPMSEVDFRVTGDLAGTARLLVAGRARRLIARRLHVGRRLARVQGDRDRLEALEALIAAPLTLRQLSAAGVRLDPALAFTLAELMIEPGWTAGERFTIGHRESPASAPGAYLHIRDGKPPLATSEAPHGPVATVIACAADELVPVLAGEPGAAFSIEGEQRHLTLVQQWLDRAQCG